MCAIPGTCCPGSVQINSQTGGTRAPNSLQHYVKGDFKGMIFMKFKNADESSVCCVASATFDLWGLGCVLYRALTRQPLFQSDDADNLISQSEARKLLDWGPTALSAALRDVEWCLDEANVPIGERLAASDL